MSTMARFDSLLKGVQSLPSLDKLAFAQEVIRLASLEIGSSEKQAKEVLPETPAAPIVLEDPLAHLACSTILDYRRGQTIVAPDQPSTQIFLVIDGKAVCRRTLAGGREIIVDVCGPDEFFGESSLLGPHLYGESVVALEYTKVMTWTAQEIEESGTRRPRLLKALLQLMTQRVRGTVLRLEDHRNKARPPRTTDCGKPLDDPLAHLPCSTILEYRKGQTIFSPEQPSASIFLVIDGAVKLTRVGNEGRTVLVDIYQPDEFFGEPAFVLRSQGPDTATACEKNTKVMVWTVDELEEIMARRPRLGLALIQLLIQRAMGLQHGLAKGPANNVARRLARALIGFSERLGISGEDGWVQMMPFTRSFLAQYIAASPGTVIVHMNNLRRLGFLRYSRRGILLHRAQLIAWLEA